jgi:hypothetical protein
MTKLSWLYTGWRRLAAAAGAVLGFIVSFWLATLAFQDVGFIAAPVVIAAGVCGAVIGWFAWPVVIPLSAYGVWMILASLAAVAAKHA